jgi:hypothetical protein
MMSESFRKTRIISFILSVAGTADPAFAKCQSLAEKPPAETHRQIGGSMQIHCPFLAATCTKSAQPFRHGSVRHPQAGIHD